MLCCLVILKNGDKENKHHMGENDGQWNYFETNFLRKEKYQVVG